VFAILVKKATLVAFFIGRLDNVRVRVFLLALLGLPLPLWAADRGLPEALVLTQRYVDAGAPELALSRIERLQPTEPSAPAWSEWEQLRCSLLAQLERNPALVERAAHLPVDMPPALVRVCLLAGARAAIVLKEGAQARQFLAQVLWKQEFGADDWRATRQLVIDSYIADDKPDDAYLLMLRYQQDYRPLDHVTAGHFVAILLKAGMTQEAVDWLPRLDDKGPVKTWLSMNTKLLAPDAAVARARAALAKEPDMLWWEVIRQAALIDNDRVLQTEVLENLLELAASNNDIVTLTAELRHNYETTAQDVANRAQLLIGDDTAWMDAAGRAVPPTAGRALYAYLAKFGQTAAARDAAQARLALSLVDSHLMSAAARLLDGVHLSGEQTDAQAHLLLDDPALSSPRRAALYALGILAERARDYRRAADYYLEAALADGGQTPDAFAARLRAANALVDAGLGDDARAQFEWLHRHVKDTQQLKTLERKSQQF